MSPAIYTEDVRDRLARTKAATRTMNDAMGAPDDVPVPDVHGARVALEVVAAGRAYTRAAFQVEPDRYVGAFKADDYNAALDVLLAYLERNPL